MNLDYKDQEEISKDTYDNDEPTQVFFHLLTCLIQCDNEENYNAEVDIYNEIVKILPNVKSINYFEIAPINIFTIFHKFCTLSAIPNFSAPSIIVSVIFSMMNKCCIQFTADFVSSLLCKFFIDNLNLRISILVSSLLSKFPDFIKILLNYDIFEKLEALEASINPNEKARFREITFYIYLRICQSYDETLYEVYLQILCIVLESIIKEDNMTIFGCQIFCLCKIIKHNHSLYQFLIGQRVLSYINSVLAENNPNKIELVICLLRQILEYVEEIVEPLSEQLSLNLLMNLVDLSQQSCKMALESVRNILTEKIYPLEVIVETNFPMRMVSILQEGSFEQKSLALQSLNNLYLVYNCHLPAIYSIEAIDCILAQLLDFTFISSNDDFESLKTIIFSLMHDGIDIHPNEMIELFQNIANDSNEDLAIQCQYIILQLDVLVAQIEN